jgi:predicted RND superfamily exporter protein
MASINGFYNPGRGRIPAEEQERFCDYIAAIQESVNRIGTAITVSGLATFFGFSALVLASSLSSATLASQP